LADHVCSVLQSTAAANHLTVELPHQPGIKRPHSPAHPNSDRPQVCGNAVVLGVLIPELAVDLEIPADLASNTCAEIKPQFVLAGVKYASVQRDNSIEARSPPLKKGITGRTRNHRGGVQLARAMI